MTIEESPETYFADLLADTPPTTPVSRRGNGVSTVSRRGNIRALLRKSFSPTITESCENAIIRKVCENRIEIAFAEKSGIHLSFNDAGFKSLKETHLCYIEAPGIRLFQASLDYHMPLFKKFEFRTSSLMLMECPCAPEFLDALASCTRSVKLTEISLDINHEFHLTHMMCTFPYLESIHLYLTTDRAKRYDADWVKILVNDCNVRKLKHLVISGNLLDLFRFDVTLLMELFMKADSKFELIFKVINEQRASITIEELRSVADFLRPARGLSCKATAKTGTLSLRKEPYN